MRRLLLLLSGLFLLAPAQEVQPHGLVFEQWVHDNFFAGYRPADYTQRWDLPASTNMRHGDELRQFDLDEPFTLVIGFSRQEGGHKRVVNLLRARDIPRIVAQTLGVGDAPGPA